MVSSLTSLTSYSSSHTSSMTRQIVDMRKDLEDLGLQMATGLKAQTYGEFGRERTLALSLRARLSSIEGYEGAITLANLRLTTASNVIEGMQDVAAEARTAMDPNVFVPLDDGRTQGQHIVEGLLETAFSMLNTKVDGRYLFSGQAVTTKPVEDMDTILNGNGTHAGFKQVREEYGLANQGAGGLGRLALTQPTATEITLTEDGIHEFGLKLGSVTSELSNTTITGPTGAPAGLTVELTDQPVAGEELQLRFNLPDGTSTDITLTATSSNPDDDTQFQIGATVVDTVTNLNAALNASVQNMVDTELNAASARMAAENFFNTEGGALPQRVDGPPFETATARRDATTDDTVFWYKGENNPAIDARDTVTAKVDDSVTVRYGARANEKAFYNTIENLAIFATEEFGDADDPVEKARYTALAERTLDGIATQGEPALENSAIEMAFAQLSAERAQERHTADKGFSLGRLSEIENADIYEVSAKVLALQTSLEASYSITRKLSELTLVNYV